MEPVSIDLNSDLGESFGRWLLGDDATLLRLVSSANVACGFHAGDPHGLRRTLRAAREAGTAVGAHPSYWDLRGFGRVPMELPPDVVRDDVLYQLGALAALAAAEEVRLQHVKPHGALYNAMAASAELARAVADAVQAFDARLPITVLAGSEAERTLRAARVPVLREGFLDRAYRSDGTLAPRGTPGAVHADPDRVVRQALELAVEGTVRTVDGGTLELQVDTLCLHGDNDEAVALARRVRAALEEAGVTIARTPLDRSA
ncbi:MAG: LamB/YcsF family protein [Deinococcales bacterium]